MGRNDQAYEKYVTDSYYEQIRRHMELGRPVGTTQAVELRCYDLENTLKEALERIEKLEAKLKADA